MPRRLLVLVLLLALGALILPTTGGGATPAAAVAPPPQQLAVFDYSMPDRFGRDDNNDGIFDYYVPTTHCDSATGPCSSVPATSPLPISPTAWRVNLDACASEVGVEGQVSYSWRDVDNVGVTFSGGPGCDQFWATVPREATFRIELTATGPDDTASVVQEVVVQDLLIVSMGDSYGSGEGNPEIDQHWVGTADPPYFALAEATWQDRRCHRSSYAGSAQAALTLERADPRTSVTFIHTACSGATLVKDPEKPAGDTSTGGILDPYNGADSPEAQAAAAGIIPPLPPQIDQVRALIGSRTIDALYISIGGNDSYFAPIVISCIALEPCNPVAQGLEDVLMPDGVVVWGACLLVASFIPFPFDVLFTPVCVGLLGNFIADFAGKTAEHWVDDGLYGPGADHENPATWRLTSLYGQLESALFDSGGLVEGGDPRKVFLSEYVDASRNDDGSFCPAEFIDDPLGLENLRLPGVSAVEFPWIYSEVELKLNQGVAYNATSRGWTLVDGIASAFHDHGICAEDADKWMVGLLAETFMRQGNMSGAVHPNINGHKGYRNRILERWLPYLYPGPAGAEPWIPPEFTGSVVQHARDWIQDYPVRRPGQPPIADPGGPYTVAEGSTFTASNDTWDGNHGAVSYSWSSADAAVAAVAPATAMLPTVTGVDNGTTSLTLLVDDAADNASASATTQVTVTNVSPIATITSVGDGSGVVLPLVAVPLSAAFTDPGKNDTHTATVDWGDGSPVASATVTESGGSGTVNAVAHVYGSPGPKTITVTVTDDDGGVGQITTIVTVVSDTQAMGDVLANLQDIADDPTQDAAVRSAAAMAVELLDGAEGGLANNGALDKLRDGDDLAALLRLRSVIATLLGVPEPARPPEFWDNAYILARIAESVASEHYAAAVNTLVAPKPKQQTELAEIAVVLANGRQAIATNDLLAAVDSFMEVTRRSDGLAK